MASRRRRRQLLVLLLLCATGSLAAGLGLAQPDDGAANCGMPRRIQNAEIHMANGTKLRYVCVKDYKRKAGTSNLVVCLRNNNAKGYQWSETNLRCVKDPLKADLESQSKANGSRQEIKPSTARRQPTTSPKSSGNPVRASTSPYRSETTLLRLTTPSPDMPRVVMRTTAVSRYPCGTATERLMPRERTTTLDSRSDTPKLSFQPRATGDNGSTAGPSRATTTRTTTTTQLPNTGILDERAGSRNLQAGLASLVVFVVLLAAVVLWYFFRNRRARGSPPLEEMPMAGWLSEGGGQTGREAGASVEPGGPSNEGAAMLSPQCSTSTG